MIHLTKSQVDRLGDRLRKGPPSDDDLKLLDNYRKSFSDAYDVVLSHIRGHFADLEIAGRQSKTNTSIIDKLHREHIRLSQMQDIAGCRIIVLDIAKQNVITSLLSKSFGSVNVVDRRIKPSFGYRAVHLIVRISGKLIEVQVRTKLQDHWAEIVEKLSDIKKNPSIKYGGGGKNIQKRLEKCSSDIRRYEELDREKYSDQEMIDKEKKLISSLKKIYRG